MVFAYIDIVIVFHCLIFGVFFLFRKGGIGNSNTYLSILLFLLSIISLPYALKPIGWIFDFPYLIDMEWAAGFLFAPFYLWFAREMTGERVRFTKSELIQLIPGLVACLYFLKFHFKSPEEQLAYLKLTQFTYIKEYEIADALFYPYIQGYFIYIIILLNRKKKNVSAIFLSNLKWLKKYTVILLSFGFFGAVVFMLGLPQVYIDILPLASASIYLILIYRFLQQSGQAYIQPVFESQNGKEEKPKYSGSNLNSSEAQRLNAELMKVMSEKKPFLKPDLTLQTLAQLIQTTPHNLSQVINQFHQKNFSGFINEARIEEAKKLILENDQLKLEAIGYECGFNTKTSFNGAFKKITGETPSEFRKKSLYKTRTDL